MKLKDKAAVITGGGRGIGRAIALAYAREGARVCVMARSLEQIEAVVAEIESLGGKAIARACDVCDSDAVGRSIDNAAASLGRLDILVNNAGGSAERGRVADSDPEKWRQTIDVNLMGTYYGAQAAIPHLIAADGGKIINIGSGMGHQARAGNSAYNVAKAGVWMLTRCLAMELWEHNIEVNELIPGPVYTDLTAGIFDPSGKVPPPMAESERVKMPDECAPLAVFLASQATGGPTGQSFSLARRPI